MTQTNPQIKSIDDVVLDEEKEAAYDTSEPEQVNKAKKRYARTRADRLKFVQAAMQHAEGRAWFYDLLVKCHVISTPFIQGDSHATAFRCGEQNIGLRCLLDIQEAAPNEYTIMIRENNKYGR